MVMLAFGRMFDFYHSIGKTSIIQSYILKTVSKSYKPTIGADFFDKKVILENPYTGN